MDRSRSRNSYPSNTYIKGRSCPKQHSHFSRYSLPRFPVLPHPKTHSQVISVRMLELSKEIIVLVSSFIIFLNYLSSTLSLCTLLSSLTSWFNKRPDVSSLYSDFSTFLKPPIQYDTFWTCIPTAYGQLSLFGGRFQILCANTAPEDCHGFEITLFTLNTQPGRRMRWTQAPNREPGGSRQLSICPCWSCANFRPLSF